MNDKPNLKFPLAPSFNPRGIAGFTNAITNGRDQHRVNTLFEPIQNSVSEKLTAYVSKRPGVADVGSTYGVSTQVAYLTEISPGATSYAAANRWVFSTSGDDIRASDTTTTTVIATAAGYKPAFVDKLAITAVDTVMAQFRNTAGAQRAFFSQAISSFTEITTSVFTGLSHQGKIEHLNGYAFISTADKIPNSELNAPGTWLAASYIPRDSKQDVGTGLGKLGQMIVSWGLATMEVYAFAPGLNPIGSPLKLARGLTQDYGMPSTIVTGMRHYYATLGGRLYWVGTNPKGVYAFNGQTVEKVSSVGIDKIISERQVYNVGTIMVQGQAAIALCLDLPDAATQRSLLFFPEWRDWTEWTSSVFIPQTTPRLADVCLGVGANAHKLFAISSAADNFQDAGSSYEFEVQFKVPQSGNRKDFMIWCDLVGDQAASSLPITVEHSDDDGATFTNAGEINMDSTHWRLSRLGSYTHGRVIRLSYTGALQPRIEKFIARVD